MAAPESSRAWTATGKWTVDFSEQDCTAYRSFKSGETVVVLGIRPRATTDIVFVHLQAPREIKTLDIDQAKIAFGQQQIERRSMVARPSGKPGYGVQTFSVTRTDLTPLEADQRLTVESAVINVDLPITGLSPVMKVLSQCTSGLLERFGLSKEAQARIATFPEPNRNIASYVTNTDYPGSAIRRGATGEVEARLTIDADGKPSDCQIVRSSGHKELDGRTCAIVTERARFKPALDRDGKPMASPYFFGIGWFLPI